MIKMCNLWVDDVRNPPATGWKWAKSYDEAIEILDNYQVYALSLDHDLGMTQTILPSGLAIGNESFEEKTGYDVACWIENKVGFDESYHPPFTIRCHSANPEGKRRIELVIRHISAMVESRRWIEANK